MRIVSAALILLLVAMVASGAGPTIQIGRPADGLVFTYQIGSTLPGAVSALVTSNLGAVPFSASASGGTWLSVSPATGTTPGTVTVSVNPSGLAPGTYTGSWMVATTVLVGGRIVDASDTSPVTLIVQAPPATNVTVTPGALTFNGTAGSPIASQNLTIGAAPAALNYTITSTAAWLSANPASGTTANGGGAVSVYVNTTGLAAGTYNGVLNIATPGGTPATTAVNVTMTLAAAVIPLTAAPPATLTFTGGQGKDAPAAQTFGVATGSSNLPLTVVGDAAWLSATADATRTPAIVTVSANQAGLTAGTYNGTITVTVPGATPSTATTAVTLNVTAPPPPVILLSATPGSVSFNATVGKGDPAAALVTVKNSDPGGDVATVTVTASQPWIKATPATGTTPLTMSIGAATAGLAVGNYSGTVTVTAGAVTTSVTVTLAVVAVPTINVTPGTISMSGQAGKAPAGAQASLALTTTSDVAVPYTIASSAAWLKLPGVAASGSVTAAAAGQVAVLADATELTAGTYTGTVTVTDGSGPHVATVTFTVAAADPPLQVSPAQLSFSALAGKTASVAQILNLTTNPGTLPFTATSPDAWLKVSPAAGSGTQPIEVTADPTGLAPGRYSTILTIASGTTNVQVAVTFEVQAPVAPEFLLQTATVNFEAVEGTTGLKRQTVALAGLDAGAVNNALIRWTVAPAVTTAAQWLSVSQIETGALPFATTVFADPSGLAAGTYNGTVTITATAGTQKTQTIAVRLVVTPPEQTSYTVTPESLSVKAMVGETALMPLSAAVVPASPGLTYTALVTGGSWLKITQGAEGAMPAVLNLTADPTGMAAGVYRATVTITATSAKAGVVLTKAVQTATVDFTVNAPPPPNVVVEPTTGVTLEVDLRNPAATGGAQALAAVKNTGSGAAQVTVQTDASWLQLSAATLTAAADPVRLLGSLNASALPGAVGTYFANFWMTTPQQGEVYRGQVSLRVTNSTPNYDVRPSGATFKVGEGYKEFTTDVLVVNTGAVAVEVFPTGYDFITPVVNEEKFTLGVGESVVKQFKIAAGLAPGVHNATANFAAVGGSNFLWKTFTASVEVIADAPPTVSDSVHSSGAAGAAVSGEFEIRNPGTQALTYYVSLGQLAGTTALTGGGVTPETGSVAAGGSVKVTVSGISGAESGLYGSLVGFSVGKSAFTRYVDYTATKAGTTCTATGLVARTASGLDGLTARAGAPSKLEVTVLDSCGAVTTGLGVTAYFSNGDSPVVLEDLGKGLWAGTWVPVNGEQPEVTITLTAQTAAYRQDIEVAAKLLPTASTPIVSAVFGAKASAAGTLAPGGYLEIQGESLALDGITTVRVGDSQPAVLTATEKKITALMGTDLVQGTYPLVVTTRLGNSVPFSVVVQAFLPSVVSVKAVVGETKYEPTVKQPAVIGGVLELKVGGITGAELEPQAVGVQIGGQAAVVTSVVVGADGFYTVKVGIPASVAAANDVPVAVSYRDQTGPAVRVAIR